MVFEADHGPGKIDFEIHLRGHCNNFSRIVHTLWTGSQAASEWLRKASASLLVRLLSQARRDITCDCAMVMAGSGQCVIVVFEEEAGPTKRGLVGAFLTLIHRRVAS